MKRIAVRPALRYHTIPQGAHKLVDKREILNLGEIRQIVVLGRRGLVPATVDGFQRDRRDRRVGGGAFFKDELDLHRGRIELGIGVDRHADIGDVVLGDDEIVHAAEHIQEGLQPRLGKALVGSRPGAVLILPAGHCGTVILPHKNPRGILTRMTESMVLLV